MIELEFKDGRATVDLVDGTRLSIINQDRNAFMNNAMPSMNLMSKAMGGPNLNARASTDLYEVAIVDFDDESRADLEPVLLAPYEDPDISTGGWRIYSYVPLEAIEAYANSVGIIKAELENEA